jgi:coenzyme F420-reducing hydrogenase delta subunit
VCSSDLVVLACDQRLCSTIEGAKRIHKRVARTQALLAEAGIEPERLVLRVVRRPALASLGTLFERIKETIAELGPSPVR